MKISTKGRYGLRILIDLATHDSTKPRLVRDIAESQQISEKYISRLIIDLRRARLVRSVRGMKGGFFLARPPQEITLLEIIETMEGTLSIVDCVIAPEKCALHTNCTARNIWQRLNNGIRELMRGITFEEILAEYNKGRTSLDIPEYCI